VKNSKRVACFLLPPPIPANEHTLLILMDGNERAKTTLGSSSYKAGARKLVEVASYLCDTTPGAHLIACALSRENIEKRSQSFFAELHEALVEFGSLVVDHALDRTHIALAGSLESLRARGGFAEACADDFEAIVCLAQNKPSSKHHLTLAVGYGHDIAQRTGTTLILRTGMPARGVLRTSGVEPGDQTLCYGTDTLWPDLSMSEVETCLDLAKQQTKRKFAKGYDTAFVLSLVEALKQIPAAVELSCRTTANAEKTEEIRRLLSKTNTPHTLHILDPADPIPWPGPHGFDVLIAPGQQKGFLILPNDPALGYGTVWPSGTSVDDITKTLATALADNNESPPLLGASRPSMAKTETVDPKERTFVLQMQEWAQTSGLITDPKDCPGALSYLRTAYHLFPDIETKRAVAQYMILVAVGDVVFDTRNPKESSEAHLHRLRTWTVFMRESITTGNMKNPPPTKADADKIVTVTKNWIVLRKQLQKDASQNLFTKWIRALGQHFVATAREYDEAVTNNPLMQQWSKDSASAILERYVPAAPTPIAALLPQLLKSCLEEINGNVKKARLELRVWLYLLDVNTIGAGLAFRTAALTIVPNKIPQGGASALDAVLPLLDYRVRLANDLSHFVSNGGRDRDEGKTNACSLLVPPRAQGKQRAEALMIAVRTITTIAKRLDVALDAEMVRLQMVWPEMATWLIRGRALGVRAYEVGHYTTLSMEQFEVLLLAS